MIPEKKNVALCGIVFSSELYEFTKSFFIGAVQLAKIVPYKLESVFSHNICLGSVGSDAKRF